MKAKNTTKLNLWDAMKAGLRGKLIALSASQKKLQREYTSNLTAQLKSLEPKDADIPKRSRRQEIIKLRAESDQIETKRTIQRINKTKIWFFEKISKIDKPLARLTRGQRESIQINKIRNECEDITSETEEIEETIRSYYKSLYSNKAGKSGRNEFLDRCQN